MRSAIFQVFIAKNHFMLPLAASKQNQPQLFQLYGAHNFYFAPNRTKIGVNKVCSHLVAWVYVQIHIFIFHRDLVHLSILPTVSDV